MLDLGRPVRQHLRPVPLLVPQALLLINLQQIIRQELKTTATIT